jgi:hypothetical protein
MTDEQINAAIAESLGWKNCKVLPKPQKYWDASDVTEMVRIGSPPVAGSCTFPDYCNNLNAMHEAEETLTEEQWDFMFGHLVSMRWRNASEDERRGLGSQKQLSPARATARQRAEAFLRTLGKWEE